MKAQVKPKVLPPQGTHMARVVSVIYLGTIEGKYGKSFKVKIGWELPEEKHVFKEGEEAKPFMVYGDYTLSMHSMSALRPIVEGILGVALKDEEAEAFDVDEILGMECMVSVQYSEDGQYANVKTATKLPKGMKCPPAITPLRLLSFEKWDQKVFDSLNDKLKEKIEKTPEYKRLTGTKVMTEDEVDENEIPF